MTARYGRALAAAVPVVLVNAVAFGGQLAFLRSHLPWPLPGQVMMAVALESVAVYLAFHAHIAELANDSALRLHLAAYGFALVIATLNYSHYMAPDWRPTFPAVAVGLMSAVSPWLWSVHSHRAARDALMARGLVEPHAVRLGPTRWLWHPLRSARVMWVATWEGITDPREAIARCETRQDPVRVSAAPHREATALTSGKATGQGQDAATATARKAIKAGQSVPSARALARNHRIGRETAGRIRASVLAEANGHQGQPEKLTVP